MRTGLVVLLALVGSIGWILLRPSPINIHSQLFMGVMGIVRYVYQLDSPWLMNPHNVTEVDLFRSRMKNALLTAGAYKPREPDFVLHGAEPSAWQRAAWAEFDANATKLRAAAGAMCDACNSDSHLKTSVEDLGIWMYRPNGWTPGTVTGALVWFHGGGHVLGEALDLEDTMKDIANRVSFSKFPTSSIF